MKKLIELTNDVKQKHIVILEDGDEFTLELEYITQQRSWFCSITYSDIFQINGLRITVHPNIMRAFQNIIPFGIMCISDSALDPFLIDDFSKDRMRIMVLTPDEVENIEELLR